MLERFDSLLENFFAKAVANEHTFAEPKGIALVVQGLEVNGGVGANDRKTDGVGTGVNRGDVNRF